LFTLVDTSKTLLKWLGAGTAPVRTHKQQMPELRARPGADPYADRVGRCPRRKTVWKWPDELCIDVFYVMRRYLVPLSSRSVAGRKCYGARVMARIPS